jgi:hypothetical protein
MVVVENVNRNRLDLSPMPVPNSNDSTAGSHLHPAVAVPGSPAYVLKECTEVWWIPNTPPTVDPPAEWIPLESLRGDSSNATSLDAKLFLASTGSGPLVLADLEIGACDDGQVPSYPFVKSTSLKNYTAVVTLTMREI